MIITVMIIGYCNCTKIGPPINSSTKLILAILIDNYEKFDLPDHFCCQNRSSWINFGSQNWCFFAKFCLSVKYKFATT